MSVNKNCMFALALREGESTHISAIDNFQFWKNSFTLTMSFFQTGEINDVVLFNQEGIIKVGYSNSNFYVKVADKEFLSEDGRMVVMPKVWNSISVAYDISSKIVSAYINGVKDFEADVSLEDELPMFNSAGDYVLGEKFIGYFRKVFCYAGIHTEDEMFQIDNIDPVDAAEHEFYLDFSAKEPKDIGKYGKNIFTTCVAFNKNIIPTIDFGECGYISSEGSEEVLSDDYTESAFTIVSKIYISDSRSSHILFAKENESCNGFFIGVFCTDGNPRLFFKNGETNVAIDRTLPLYTWLDLAFVCSNKRIQVFCDGEEFGECELPGEFAFSSNKFTIGNAATQSSYKSFCGYIDYVAVFNGVKAKDELKKYISDIPYIYSKDISALYYLSDVNAVELINSKKIIINESVCCFAEDTQRVETDMLTYDNECENEISISSYDQWQGSLAAGLFLGSISSMGIRHRFGLDSNGMPTQSVAREFTKRVSSIPEHMEICLNSTSITPAMTQSYLSALESAGILGSLGTLFGISSFEVDKFAIAILGAAAIGACSVLIATACEKGSDIILNNDNKEPPEQDPEDEKTVVYLKSITFAHNPQDKSSAVYLRRSENQSSSEWELGQTDATDALYIADRHENVSVKATIVFNKPFVGTILAKAVKTDDGILGDLEETKITVDSLTYPAEVEVSLKLARANFHDVKLGSYIDNLTWAARSEKEQIIFGTITHRTWILETEPLEQWNILEKDEAKNISVDTLKILDEIRKYDSSKEAGCKLSLTDADSWMKQMVHFIHDSDSFKYNKDKEYVFSTKNDMDQQYLFDMREFEKKYNEFKENKSLIDVSSLDSSLIIQCISSLLGLCSNVAYIWGNNRPAKLKYDSETKIITRCPPLIHFKEIMTIEGEYLETLSVPNRYYVCALQNGDLYLLYDSCLSSCEAGGTGYQKKHLSSISFTQNEYTQDIYCSITNNNTYREIVTPVGCMCCVSHEAFSLTLDHVSSKRTLNEVKHELLESNQIQSVVFDVTTKKFIFKSRDEKFDVNFRNNKGLDVQDYKILAHRISYKYILNVVINSLNFFFSNKIDAQKYKKIMETLCDLIFGDKKNGVCDNQNCESDNANKNEVLIKVDEIIRNISTSAINITCVVNPMIRILTCNSYFNVKIGNNRWNSSIRDYMDVDNNWIMSFKMYDTYFYINGYSEIPKIFEPNEQEKKQMCDLSIRLQVSKEDSFRFIKMQQLDDVSEPLFPCIYKNTTRNDSFIPSCSDIDWNFSNWEINDLIEWENYVIINESGEVLMKVF